MPEGISGKKGKIYVMKLGFWFYRLFTYLHYLNYDFLKKQLRAKKMANMLINSNNY